MAARVEVEGLEHVPSSGAFILAGNHLSMSDVPVGWTHMERSMIPLVSHDLRQTRWLRWVLSGIGHAVYIRRGEGDEDALTRGLAVLRAGGAILIAPEGKRSPGGLRRGNTGAAYLATRAGVPVVPVAAWGQEDFTSSWRRLRRAPVRLHFGPPLDFPVGPLSGQELLEHSERIMLAIARMLPPEYRGVYADTVAAEGVETTPGGVAEQRDTVGVTEPE
jgi:1-acyl-sn-glycerol-3-phosphate acyltransferase